MVTPGRWRWVVGGLVGLVGLGAEPAAATSAVTFDPQFGGGDGVRIVQPSLGATNINVNDVAVGLDGAIWMVGSVLVAGDFDMFACRVDPGGGAHSCVVLAFDLGGTLTDRANAVVVDLAGRAFVVGTVSGPAGDTEPRVAAVRLTSGVALDSSFGGGDGKVDLPLGGAVNVVDAALMTDGRVVFAGSIDLPLIGGGVNQNVLVGRLLDTGGWDTSFDGDGRRAFGFDLASSNADAAGGVVVAADGSPIVSASAGVTGNQSEIRVARLTPSGALDSSFDGDGVAVVTLPGTAPRYAFGVRLDRRGRILVAGKNQGLIDPDEVVVARFLDDGNPDATFGIAGVSRHEVEGLPVVGVLGPLMAPGPVDAAVVVGRVQTGVPADATDTYTLRVDANGDPDSGWGSGSGVETQSTIPSVGGAASYFWAAAFQEARLVVAGVAAGTNSGFVARLRVDELFADDFEGGSTAAWSVVVGVSGPGG